MLVAIFGLIGVVVGAAVTGGIDFLLERRHEQADERQAKRLIATEIHSLWVHLGLLVETHLTPKLQGQELEEKFLPTVLWAAHRTALARAVTDQKVWEELFVFYDNITLMRWQIAEMQPFTAVPTDDVESLHEKAAWLYEQLTGRPPTHD